MEEVIEKVEETKPESTSYVIAPPDIDDTELDKLLEEQQKAAREPIEGVNPEEVKEEKTEPETPKDETVKPEETEDNTNVVINDEYIETQPEDIQSILKSIKGKRESLNIDAHLLKNYINAQKYISEIKPKLSEYEERIQSYEERQQQKYEIDEKERDSLVLSRLRGKYAQQGIDLPEDFEEFEAYLSDLSTGGKPLLMSKIMKDMERIQTSVEDDLRQVSYIKNNYNKVLNDSLSKAKEGIISYFKDAGIDNIEDILAKEEYDFTKMTEGQANKLLKDLINNDGKPDNSVVGILGTGDNRVVLISPNGLKDKYISKLSAKIFKSHMDLVRAQGVSDGISKKETSETPPSISASGKQNKIESPSKKSLVADFEDDDELIDKKNNELKKLILNGKQPRF